MKTKYVKRAISLEKKQDKWVKKAREEMGFNFSNFVQRKLRELIKNGGKENWKKDIFGGLKMNNDYLTFMVLVGAWCLVAIANFLTPPNILHYLTYSICLGAIIFNIMEKEKWK